MDHGENCIMMNFTFVFSPNIVTVIKSRRMRWAGHVARMGKGEVFAGFWLGGPKARDRWEDLGIGIGILSTLHCH
jgi:hypothetical protein